MSRHLDPVKQYSEDGEPVVAGNAYFGNANTDPTVLANQIPIFSDRALTVPLAQPVATDAQGRLVTNVYMGANEYSYQVFDALGNLILDEPLLEPMNIVGLVTANIDMNGYKHTNVADGSANDQYSTVGQSNKIYPYVLETNGSSTPDALQVTPPIQPAALVDGMQIIVRLTHGTSTAAAPTLKFGTEAPKTIARDNDQTLEAGDTGAQNGLGHYVYDGDLDKWMIVNPRKQKNNDLAANSVSGSGGVGTNVVEALSIGSGEIAGSAITEGKIAGGAVTVNKIGSNAVDYSKFLEPTAGTTYTVRHLVYQSIDTNDTGWPSGDVQNVGVNASERSVGFVCLVSGQIRITVSHSASAQDCELRVLKNGALDGAVETTTSGNTTTYNLNRFMQRGDLIVIQHRVSVGVGVSTINSIDLKSDANALSVA